MNNVPTGTKNSLTSLFWPDWNITMTSTVFEQPSDFKAESHGL